jgi:nucleoside-diphosphate-sugar epimerase
MVQPSTWELVDEGRPARQQRILLTGGAGVVGHALLPRLGPADLTCLVHHAPIERPAVTSVSGDLTAPGLGLDRRSYARLANRIDVVVHCAAVTNFNRDDGTLEATNIGGTEEIAAFAEDAGAHLVHVSTAYLHARADGERGRKAVRYATSKRAAEEIVGSAAVPHAILRPSIVIGDSRTGYIRAFQGLHLVAGAVLDGFVPVAPFDPSWPVDFVSSDVVADAIATAVEHRMTGVRWITAGDQALTLASAMGVVETLGEELGVAMHPVRFVPPEVFDRLFAPVFLSELPRRVRHMVVNLLEYFAAYLAVDEPLPSDLGSIAAAGGFEVPDPHEALLTSLRYWAMATGRVDGLAAATAT